MSKALNGQDTGTVMWWSTKDNNGIILDDNKNEIYFDSSVINEGLSIRRPMRGELLKFDLERLQPDNILVAKRVSRFIGR
jgi:cold shock CspA family protein